MSLEDLLDKQLAGEAAEIPADLREDLQAALRAHEAIQFALGETILAPESAPAERAAPVLPGDYEIVRELGRGGMGVVYLARQKSLGRNVAVKVLRPGEALYGPIVQRFMEEARHMARVRHPNIVTVHEVGTAAGEPYFTMDYVEGEALSAALRRGRMAPTRAIAILRQAAEAVKHAHEHGVVHRDLKPGNILLGKDGRAYVSDFGLARDMTRDSSLTCSGEILGTPAYMAPEQALGEGARVGERTDVHALGAVLYEMLTGKAPYGSDAPARVLSRLLHEDPPTPRSIDSRVPRDLETICLKALEKSPDRRYSSVGALLEDLRRFGTGEAIQAKRPSAMQRMLRGARRHSVLLAAIAAAALALALSPWIFLFDRSAKRIEAAALEARGRGEPDIAIRLLCSALPGTAPEDRPRLRELAVDCCRDLGETREGLEACLRVAEVEPDVSFGPMDSAVAMTLADRAIEKNGHGELHTVPRELVPELRRLDGRLKILLDGRQGSPLSRKRAETLRQYLTQYGLEGRSYGLLSRPSPHLRDPEALPQGPDKELERIANGGGRSWGCGQAFFVLGERREGRGEPAEALRDYERAVDFLSDECPVLSGVVRWDGKAFVPHPACNVLRRALDAAKRLDPERIETKAGKLVLKVAMQNIPKDVRLRLRLDISRTKFALATAKQVYDVRPEAEPDESGTAEVGILQGTWYVSIQAFFESGNPSREGWIYRRLSLEPQELQDPVTIGDEPLAFPVKFRSVASIVPEGPPADATVDLNRTVLRWTAAPGASIYRVQLCLLTSQGETAHRVITVGTPRLAFAELAGEDADALRNAVREGDWLSWSVAAFEDGKGWENRNLVGTMDEHAVVRVGRVLAK